MSSFLEYRLNSYLADPALSFPVAVLLAKVSFFREPPYDLEPIMKCDRQAWDNDRERYVELLRRKCRISTRYVQTQYHYELFFELLPRDAWEKFFTQEALDQGRIAWKIRNWYMWQYEADNMRKLIFDYRFQMLMLRSPDCVKNLVPDLFKICRSYITDRPEIARRSTFEDWLDAIMLADEQRRPVEIELFLTHLESLNFEPAYADIAMGLFLVFGYSFDNANAEYTIHPIGWNTLDYVIRHPTPDNAKRLAILLRGQNADAIRELMRQSHQEETWNTLLQPWQELIARKPTDQPYADTFPVGVFNPLAPIGRDEYVPPRLPPANSEPPATGFSGDAADRK